MDALFRCGARLCRRRCLGCDSLLSLRRRRNQAAGTENTEPVNLATQSRISSTAPVVTEMLVIPVAGQDSMLLNLSGAHGPFFTRNVVVLRDNDGHTGLGEVPGGEPIRQTLEDARALVEGRPIGTWNNILSALRREFADRDAAGRGAQTFDLRVAVHAVTAVESALLDLMGQF